MRYFRLILLLCSNCLYAQNEVNVIGVGKNTQQETGIGLNSRFEARTASGLLMSDLVEEFPSMQEKSYSQSSASGMDSISLRHQDTRYTEIWLDHVLISNPLTNFPFHLGTDLSSLGSIKIHEGPGPLSIQSSSTAGSMELISKKNGNQSLIGLVSGNVYGNSLFGLVNLDSQYANLAIYLRKHQAPGSYTYYSDNLTPYNTSDDSLKKRQSNSSFSNYGLLRGDYHFNQHSLSLLAIKEGSGNDLPVPDNRKTSAEVRRSLDLSRLTYKYDFLSYYLLLSRQIIKTGQSAIDPYQYIFLDTKREEDQSSSEALDLALFQSREGLSFNIRASTTTSNIETANSQIKNRYSRTVGEVSTGVEISFENQTSMRTKASINQLKNVHNDTKLPLQYARDGSASWLHTFSDQSIWMTFATQERLPSLFEIYGDLSGVSGNLDLKGERSRLMEAGLNVDGWHSHGKLCLHQIETVDKIAFVQSSSRQVKAKNIANTRLHGLSILIEENFHPISLKQNFYISKAIDTKSKSELPFTPNFIATISARYQFLTHLSSSVMIIGRSRFNRDEANTSTSPESLRMNAFLDYSWRNLETSFSVINVFNELSQEIQNTASGERGATYISDYSGYPLPGRQFKLSTLYRF